MDRIVWPCVAGSMVWAANILAQRCGAEPLSFPEEDNISRFLRLAGDVVRRGKEPGMKLEQKASVFGHLGGKALSLSEEVFSIEQLQGIVKPLLRQMAPCLDIPNEALLQLCEKTFAQVPCFPGDSEDGDLSLYDIAVQAAALASCWALWEGTSHSDEALCSDETLLLFSCDFSGIQSFLYLIASKYALKTLRGRSFFLELLMEHLLDELLESCGLSRANVIYSGGGHAYVLLPNTPAAQKAVDAFGEQANHWLSDQFDIELYLAWGAVSCSAEVLFGQKGSEACAGVFRELSGQLSQRKTHRYSAGELRRLNGRSSRQDGRECRVCGRTAFLTGPEDECAWCRRMRELGGKLTGTPLALAVFRKRDEGTFPLPGLGEARWGKWIPAQEADGFSRKPSTVRLYSINEPLPHLPDCRCLWVGEHCPTSLLEDLAEDAIGLRRIGVYRADVDNLGNAFVRGFAVEDGPGYVSLTRTASFSRTMSRFFKHDLVRVLKDSPGGDKTIVIYSGGDDLFLLGAWDGVLDSSRIIHDAFREYTGGSLTLSGGLGLYRAHYPLARSALEVAELEDFSKQREGKDAVTLFSPENGFRFSWTEFEEKVMKEKYSLLENFFSKGSETENERGTAFLYKLSQYLQDGDEKINLARCAYLLARLRPGDRAEKAVKDSYAVFSKGFYQWALDPENRKQLIAAIMLYVYLHRGEKEE